MDSGVAQRAAESGVIRVLPAGYRPQRDCNWPAVLNAATMGTIEIRADGTVHSRTFSAAQASAAQAFTSLEGVSFRPTDP